jgi:hypothetical protein
MRATLLNAWAFALIGSIGVYFCIRAAKMPKWCCLLIAAAMFQSPLGRVLSSSNSFIFANDVLTPFLIFYALWKISSVPARLGAALALLIISLGAIPTVMAIAGSTNAMTIMQNLINLYRVLGAVALCMVLVEPARSTSLRPSWIFCAFSWIAIVIVAAMFLQDLGGIDSNVVFRSDHADPTYTDLIDMRHVVMGMWRGNLGIAGCLAAIFGTLVPASGFKQRLLLYTGATAGAVVTIFSGAKTSIIASVALTLLGLGIAKRSSIGRLASLLIVLSLMGTAWVVINDAVPGTWLYNNTPPLVLALVQQRKGATLESRQEVWSEGINFATAHPGTAFGVEPLPGEFGQPHYYHNEYISVIMLGGIWTVTTYALGLIMLWPVIRRCRKYGPYGAVFGFVFLCGCIHGLTGSHLQPHHLYAQSVVCFAVLYGIAAGMGSAPKVTAVLTESDIRDARQSLCQSRQTFA